MSTTKERIKSIITREGLSQVDFSTRTGIKTSTLSHVLTGRNNASSEVVDKILAAFPNYEAEWLLNGVGPMLTSVARIQEERERSIPLFREVVPTQQTTSPGPGEAVDNVVGGNIVDSGIAPFSKKQVEKVIIYYDDNTYEVLLPASKKNNE